MEQDTNINSTNEDIEIEIDNEDIPSEISSFNRNDVKTSPLPINLGQIIQAFQGKKIKLETEFQRLPNLWNNTKKSRFIESILLNLPIPSFYFAEDENNNWEIIDGLQRISTLIHFTSGITTESGTLPPFGLENLEFLKEFNGKFYQDLNFDIQFQITTYAINATLIDKRTPEIVKYQIFKRINQGGLVLTPQEIRHALNQGKPADLVKELVNKNNIYGKAFSKATGGGIGTHRMEDRDFVTRFLSFYLIGYENYVPDLDSFMNLGMQEIKNLNQEKIDNLKKDFEKSMRICFEIFGNDAFRKRLNIDDRRKPINKSLFDSISANVANFDENQCLVLVQKKEIIKQKLMDLHNNPDGKFLRAITQGTAQKDLVLKRFSDIKNIFQQTLTGND